MRVMQASEFQRSDQLCTCTASTETMSKGHQLVDQQQPGPSKETLVKTDWNKCLFCQEITPEVLRCPAKSKDCDVGAGQGYSTLSSNIICFSEPHKLPIPIIDLGRLDEGNGIEATLLERKAKWHKSCHTKFNQYHKVEASRKEEIFHGRL